MKKWIMVSGALIGFLILGLVGWKFSLRLTEVPKTSGPLMKIAHNYWPGQFWKEIAYQKGWFKAAGLNVELVDTNPDYYSSLKDAAEGKIDVNSFTAFDLVQFNLEGADLVIVLSADTSFGVDAIVARKEIKDIAGLRGKKVGLAMGTYAEFLLDTILSFSGLKPEDVIKVEVLTETATKDFASGALDAIVTWEPLATEAREKANGHTLFDTSQSPGIITSVTPFKRSFIEQRPQDVQAYVNTWHRTTQYIKENPDEAFGILADIYNVSLQDVKALAALDKISDLHENLTRFTYGTGFENIYGNLRLIISFLKEKGVVSRPVDVTDFIDTRFIREIGR